MRVRVWRIAPSVLRRRRRYRRRGRNRARDGSIMAGTEGRGRRGDGRRRRRRADRSTTSEPAAELEPADASDGGDPDRREPEDGDHDGHVIEVDPAATEAPEPDLAASALAGYQVLLD